MDLRSIVAIVATTALFGSCSISSSNPSPPRLAAPSEPASDVRFEPKRRVVDNLCGENVSVSFDLVNTSDHVVRLTSAQCKWGSLRVDTPAGESIAACRLQGGRPSPLTIAAGARVTLVDGFDGNLACEPEAREECWVRAWIDDASGPIEATIRWWRHPLQAVHGDATDLGDLEPRGTIERRFTIESEELGRFEVKSVGIPSDDPTDPKVVAALDVKGRDVTPPGEVRTTYEVVVRIDTARLPYGEGGVPIVASLRRARVSPIRIGLHWKVTPPFDFVVDGAPVADSIQFGLVRKLDTPLHRIVFHSRDPAHPVRVRAAHVESIRDASRVPLEVGTIVEGDTPLDLSLTETPRWNPFRGELVVETDDPRAPEWRKRVSWIWNGAAANPTGK